MTINLTLPDLEEHLKKLQLNPQQQKETSQLVVLFKIDGHDFPLFFRIFEGQELLQLIAFVPCNLKKSAVAELARLLHLINKEMDLPGFGMDEKAGIIYYRIMLPAEGGQIASATIDSVCQSIPTILETFSPVIATVSAGATSFEDVLNKLSQSQSPQ
jgi:hypothetical protein